MAGVADAHPGAIVASRAAPALSLQVAASAALNAQFEQFAALGANQYSNANPAGIINFGIAENSLMQEELKAFFHANFQVQDIDFSYGDHVLGSSRLFAALCKLFNKYFDPVTPVLPDHVVTGNGCGAIIDQTIALLANPGDVVLIAKPFYSGFFFEVARTRVQLVGVDVDQDAAASPAALDAFEATIQALAAAGRTTRAVLLCNPHNPLGLNYPRATLAAYCRFCERHDVHLLSDEIYALTQFANAAAPGNVPFTSMLALDVRAEAACNPARVHVLYGMSKDFCANGLRAGVFVTQHNPELRRSFLATGLLMKVSSVTDGLWTALLTDEAALAAHIQTNQARLADTFARCRAFFEEHGVPLVQPSAAMFIWLDLSKYWRAADDAGAPLPSAQERDADLWRALLRAGVFVGLGASYGGTRPGWFRFTFCVRRDVLDVGLARVAGVLRGRAERAQVG